MTKRLVRAAAVATAIVLMSFASTPRRAHAQTTPPSSDAESGSPPPASPAPLASPAPPASAPTSKRTAWPWIVMGTGVALIATAAVLQFRSISEDNERESDETKLVSLPAGDPARKALQASAADHDSSASNSRTASLVIGTVGFFTVAGAVVWWFFEGGSGSSSGPASAKTKPTFTPSFAPGYAGASLGASF